MNKDKLNRIQPHSQQELIAMFESSGYPNQFYYKFLARYTDAFNEFKNEYEKYDDDDFEESDKEEVKAHALSVTTEYIGQFMKEINIGHNEEWATLVAENSYIYADSEYNDQIDNAYWTLRKEDEELAKKELQIHAKSFGEDELFEQHYLNLFEHGYCMHNPQEVARNYSKIYKQQIASGERDIYAHHYADKKACDEFTDIFCEKYAYAFEQAVLRGFNEHNARFIAYDYADAIANEYHYLYLTKYIKNFPENITQEELDDFILNTVLTYEQNNN